MSKATWTTLGIIAAVTLGLIGWDVYLLYDGEPGNTISAAINRAGAYAAPALGYLMGHFFAPPLDRRPEKLRYRPDLIDTVVVGSLLLLTSAMVSHTLPEQATWIAFGSLFISALAGAVFWPQSGKESP